MTLVNCDYCGKEIEKTNGQLKKYKHHFCSIGHSALFFKIPKILVICEMCGIEFEKRACDIKTTKHNFCSRSCSYKWRGIPGNFLRQPFSEAHKLAIGRGNKGKLKGRKRSEETQQKLNGRKMPSGKDHWAYGRTGKLNPMYGKRSHSHGQWYINKWTGRSIWLRSSWEVAVAEYFYDNCIVYEYEPDTFEIGDTTYTPDFYLILENKYIEVKGYMSRIAQMKIDLFRESYSDINLELWDMQVLLNKKILQEYLDEKGLKYITKYL